MTDSAINGLSERESAERDQLVARQVSDGRGCCSGSASDLAAGQVKRARLLRRRAGDLPHESGQINVLDAICQHLGATWASAHRRGEHIVGVRGTAGTGTVTHQRADPYSKIAARTTSASRTSRRWSGRGFILDLARAPRPRAAPYWQPPVLPKLEPENTTAAPAQPHAQPGQAASAR